MSSGQRHGFCILAVHDFCVLCLTGSVMTSEIRDILYNTDIINPIVKLIVHSPAGKLA